MFESLNMAPPDAILGLSEQFRLDPNPNKINLSVGVFQNAEGKTPTLESVQEAERRLLQERRSKGYLPIDGLPAYCQLVRDLLLGAEHEAVARERAVTVQTPGGTAALRVAADLIQKLLPSAHVWCSQPTWPNHPAVFSAAGLKVEIYPYFDTEANGLAWEALLAAFKKIPPQHVVCLHACCHNPTGVDLTRAQWQELGQIIHDRKLLPLIDFAYQGFGDGIEEDATGILEVCRPGCEALICNSFSKNFGLYSERVGGLTIVGSDAEDTAAAVSHAKICVRSNYSNPPAHGAEVVATVLGDKQLRRQWEAEVAGMRSRIQQMRELFASTMRGLNVRRNFDFILRQRGMFSFVGLTPLQVDQLRTEHAIYIVSNGRINVAGMTERTMEPLCRAIASVL